MQPHMKLRKLKQRQGVMVNSGAEAEHRHKGEGDETNRSKWGGVRRDRGPTKPRNLAVAEAINSNTYINISVPHTLEVGLV